MTDLPTNGGIPWDHTPEFLALTQRTIPLGGQTEYTHPHPIGRTPNDVTTFVYGQRDVDKDNWPEIMYMLYPTREWKIFRQSRKPPQKLDPHGQPIFERWPRDGKSPRVLLQFDVLPDKVWRVLQCEVFLNSSQISSSEEWWYIDLWRRVDPRIVCHHQESPIWRSRLTSLSTNQHWYDITMRIEQPAGRPRTAESDHRLANATQNMARRLWHSHCYIFSWFHHRNFDQPNKARTHVLSSLEKAGISELRNSTRGLSPGLIDPAKGPNSKRISHPKLRPNVGQRRKLAAVAKPKLIRGTTARAVTKEPRAIEMSRADEEGEDEDAEINDESIQEITDEAMEQNVDKNMEDVSQNFKGEVEAITDEDGSGSSIELSEAIFVSRLVLFSFANQA